MKRLVAVLGVSAALSFGAVAPVAFADPTPSPAPASPSAGKFCSKDQEGKSANDSSGATFVCAAGSDGKDRWTASQEGVSAGKFCSKDLEGKTAADSSGKVLVCNKGADGKDRWATK